jgi:hypothetical protein
METSSDADSYEAQWLKSSWRNCLKSPDSAKTKALGAPEAGQAGPISLPHASDSYA